MKNCLLVFIFLIHSLLLTGAAPEVVIKGRVFDQATGNGLPGTSITYKTNQGTTAGENGNYLLKITPGNNTLIFQYIGFKTTSRTLKLFANDTLVLDIGLEYEAAFLEQVVVSAGRVEQKISELTVSMNVISPEIMANNHITDTKELINKTSGIEVLDGQASIRGGSGFSYGAGSRVLALLDGLPVMAADAGNIRWGFLPLENISQIEIIKGASSVAYGSSALNGVINFRTADASDKPVTKFFIESGIFDLPSNNNWKWWDTPQIFSEASFSHIHKMGNTDLAIGANVMNDNGYRKLNDEKSGRVNLKLKHFNKNVDGLFYGLSFNGGKAIKTDFILWEDALNGALKQDESTAIEANSTFFTLDPFLSYKTGQKTKHDFRARFQSSQNKFPDSKQNDSRATNFYAEYQLGYEFSDKLSLNAGLSENLSRINSNFYGNHNGFNAGAFAQFDWFASDRMRLTSGVRLEQNWLDGKNDKLIPLFRAGMNYRILDYTFLRASFGQGYRYPSIAEKHASTTLGSVKIFPSIYIQPEKGWNAEVGAKQGIMTDFFTGFFDVALFYTQNRDMIEYLFGIHPNPGEETFSYGFKAYNIEASRVYGCEVQFLANKDFSRFKNTLSGGYVFMVPVEYNTVTKKNTGVMLKYRRKHSVTLNYHGTFEKFELGAGLYKKSKILNIDDVFLNELSRESLLPGFYEYWISNNKGYFLVDVNVGFNLTSQYKISFVVKNLANTEYMGRPGDIQPQRNFSLRFSGNL
ncbi:MAG: TonB-dependent receptor [Mariniphaga sp.]|nr:TonB-dependent receptor [Mariniphaga sp.]